MDEIDAKDALEKTQDSWEAAICSELQETPGVIADGNFAIETAEAMNLAISAQRVVMGREKVPKLVILAIIANAAKLSTYYTVSLGAATSSTLEQPSPTTENSEELDLCNGVHSVILGDIRKYVDDTSSKCSSVFKLKCYGILGEIGNGVAQH